MRWVRGLPECDGGLFLAVAQVLEQRLLNDTSGDSEQPLIPTIERLLGVIAENKVLSFAAIDAHQMTWCCKQKLRIKSGDRQYIRLRLHLGHTLARGRGPLDLVQCLVWPLEIVCTLS
jgi:hypothetical protein